jgi:hypothetical protein
MTASGLGSLGSIEANEAGTSKPTPQRFTTSLRNATHHVGAAEIVQTGVKNGLSHHSSH